VGFVLLVALSVVAVFAPMIAPYDPMKLSVSHRLEAPSAEHLMGTDDFGRDILSRVVYGARLSLMTGAAISTLSACLGLVLGIISGFYRWPALVLMRIVDALMAFPSILLALAITAITGKASLTNVIIALAVVYTPQMARIAYSATLTIRQNLYVEACRAIGVSNVRVMLRHVLPNFVSLVIVQTTFIFGWAILGAASLDFLGVGTPPSLPAWGAMVNGGRVYITRAPWMILFPGAFVFMTVLALNLLGDALRDMLDPQLRKL
jgi:peptide/nickel transport system permease protein